MVQKVLLLGSLAVAAVLPDTADAKFKFISCEMVRAYVAQVGLVQAREIALAHGMTPSQEREARHCLGV